MAQIVLLRVTFFLRAKTTSRNAVNNADRICLPPRPGYRQHKLSEFDDSLDPALALITDWMQISGNNGFSLDMLSAVLDSLAREDICTVLRSVSSESGSAAAVLAEDN